MDPIGSISIAILTFLGLRKVIHRLRGEGCDEVYPCGEPFCRQDMMQRLRLLAYRCQDGFGDGDPTRDYAPGTLLFATSEQLCARGSGCDGGAADIHEISPSGVEGLSRMLRVCYFCETCGHINTLYGGEPFGEFSRLLKPGMTIGAAIAYLETRAACELSKEEEERLEARRRMLENEVEFLRLRSSRSAITRARQQVQQGSAAIGDPYRLDS